MAKSIDDRARELVDHYHNGVGGRDQSLEERIAAFAREVRVEAMEEAAAVCNDVVDEYRNLKTTPAWTAQEAERRLRKLASTARAGKDG